MARASQVFAWSVVSLGWGLMGFYVGRLHPQDRQAVTRVLAAPTSGPVMNVPSVSHAHSGPSIEQVRKLSSLVTMKVEVADAQVTSIQGQTGGMRVGLLVRGDLLMSTDLSRARFEAIDASARTAVLVLPAPAATNPRVDHARTRVLEATGQGLWCMVPGDAGRSKAVSRAYAEAQGFITGAAADPALTLRSRQHAESVLGVFFEALGWRVRVRWID